MSRPINTTLVRTLNNLERLLLDHNELLAALDCEDPEAAELILGAIDVTAIALRNTRDARRKELRAAGVGADSR